MNEMMVNENEETQTISAYTLHHLYNSLYEIGLMFNSLSILNIDNHDFLNSANLIS